MHIIIEMIYCFNGCSVDNQRGRSGNKVRKYVFKHGVKETNIVNQTVPHRKRFAENEWIAKTGNKEHQYTENFVYSRWLLHFYLFLRYFVIILKQTLTFRKEERMSVVYRAWFFKDALSGLRLFLSTEGPLKMMKIDFYLTSKALPVLEIFKFLS